MVPKQALDRLGHGRRGLAGPNHPNTSNARKIEFTFPDPQAVAHPAAHPRHRLPRFHGPHPGPEDRFGIGAHSGTNVYVISYILTFDHGNLRQNLKMKDESLKMKVEEFCLFSLLKYLECFIAREYASRSPIKIEFHIFHLSSFIFHLLTFIFI
jgi:hypothetical protein